MDPLAEMPGRLSLETGDESRIKSNTHIKQASAALMANKWGGYEHSARPLWSTGIEFLCRRKSSTIGDKANSVTRARVVQ